MIIKYLIRIGDGCVLSSISSNNHYAWHIVNTLSNLGLVTVRRVSGRILILPTTKARKVLELYDNIVSVIEGEIGALHPNHTHPELKAEDTIESSIPAEMPSFIKGNPWVTVLKSRRR